MQIPDQFVADLRGMTYRSLTAISTASDDHLRERSETDRLTELGVQAMVLYDSQDKRWQPDSFEDCRRVPGIRIASLDCGHTPMVEDPDSTGASSVTSSISTESALALGALIGMAAARPLVALPETAHRIPRRERPPSVLSDSDGRSSRFASTASNSPPPWNLRRIGSVEYQRGRGRQ
ncbi:hypothetical protein ACW9HJ_30735 [Nocardia gipuzkoensis]